MQKHYPVGATQWKVLEALGLTADNFDHANAIFAAFGLSVGSKRVGRTTEPVITLAAAVGGAFNAYGEGETWDIPHGEIDLTPILPWIIERDQAEAQARIRRFQAKQANASDDNGEKQAILLSDHAPERGYGPDSVAPTHDGTYLTTWRDEHGDWYACLSGIYHGNYFESEDMGPFTSRARAEEAGRDAYAEDQQPPEAYDDYGDYEFPVESRD